MINLRYQDGRVSKVIPKPGTFIEICSDDGKVGMVIYEDPDDGQIRIINSRDELKRYTQFFKTEPARVMEVHIPETASTMTSSSNEQ